MKQTVYLIQAPPLWIKTPPLSLVFLENYLKQKKIKVKILDLNQIIFKILSPKTKSWLNLNKTWENNLFAIIEKKYPHLLENIYTAINKYDIIGFSLFNRNLSFSFSLREKIKKLYPQKKIVFGGPATMFLDKKNRINTKKDYWIIGEGEKALYDISQNKKNNIYRFSEINDLDSLPFYNFDSLNISNYSHHLPLFSSRGCKFRCNFCTECLLYKKFRTHSPEYMAEQISYLKNKYNTNYFIFCDSFLNHNKRWLHRFCELTIKNKLNIKWEAQFRVDKDLKSNLADLIKRSGCYNLFIGLESASNRILQAMDKGFSSKDALSFFKTLKNANLHFETSLIFGYPEESENDFNATVNFILKNKNIIPKIAQVNPFINYLGSFRQTDKEKEIAKKRVKKFIKIIEQENITYTKSFINNLTYQ